MNVREIKFRAWEEESKQMITEPEFIQVCTEKSYAVFVESWGEWATKGFVLMQFTGLKDKNGREIYEGDIIRYIAWTRFHEDSFPVIAKVEYREKECGFSPMICHTEVEDGFYNYEIEDIEVIGNVWETPEAIKEGGGR